MLLANRRLAHNTRRPNTLRIDPTRTTLIRQRFMRDVAWGFDRLKRALTALVVKEDAFGLGQQAVVVHQRYRALTQPQQLGAFRRWVQAQIDEGVLRNVDSGATNWLQQYIQEAYDKGAGRAFDDAMRKYKERYPAELKSPVDYYRGSREQFLRSAFRSPASAERVVLLASRTYTDLKGVTQEMSTRLNRVMTDSIIQGRGPRDTGRQLNKIVDGYKNRGLTIARTETIRAHADGQLEALRQLGVEEVGVMVEWSTASDDLVCDLCAELDGMVIAIDKAGGMIPRHPNCRCAWIPANVGEDKTRKAWYEKDKRSEPVWKDVGQKRGRDAARAIDKSIKKEAPRGRTLEEQREKSRWQGADVKPGKPLKSVLDDTGRGPIIQPSITQPEVPVPTMGEIEKARKEWLSVKKRGLSSEGELRDKWAGLVQRYEAATGRNYVVDRGAWEAERLRIAAGVGPRPPVTPPAPLAPVPTPTKARAARKPTPASVEPKAPAPAAQQTGDIRERLEEKGLNIKALKMHAQIKPELAAQLLEDTLKQLDNIARAFPKANPAKWKGKKRIRLSFTNADHVATQSKRASGVYKVVGNKISIATRTKTMESGPIAWGQWNIGRSVGDTVRHEIGHHVYHNFLSLEQMNAWEMMAKEYVGKGWLVSQYGATNSAELFAESFSALTHSGYNPAVRELPEGIAKFFKGVTLK